MRSEDPSSADGLAHAQSDSPSRFENRQEPGSSRTGGSGRPPGTPPQDQDGNDGGGQRFKQRHAWHLVAYVFVALIALYLFQQFVFTDTSSELEYSDFKARVAAGQVASIEIGQQQITGVLKASSTDSGGTAFHAYYDPDSDPDLIAELQAAGVEFSFSAPANPAGGILLSLLPFLLIGVVWYIVYRRMVGLAGRGGGVGGVFGVGKSKATKVEPEKVGVTFKDVGGADEAIAELQEIIQFLKTPERFARLGGRIPKGVLLVGPPGTGKTLLAKATAGEAGVDFFESSGSEFVEMFVGVGAARVRDLFEQARKSAPAIVFIDEIDAIGQSRGMGLGQSGMNDEREQTLNQLLAEIDGFSTDASRPVIIMAATNRPEVLDKALLRAGRFDRHVEVGNPDLIGRVQILKIHSKDIKLARDFDLERAARITPGFSGADLANAINEAALLAARGKSKTVTIKDFEIAMERVVAGLEKKSRLMNAQERKTVAYHESGHALIASLVPHADPVAKISIIPHARGALGFTMQMPAEDRYILTQDELSDRVAVMLGGRAAEQTVFSAVSTGASDDIQKATELAHRMVTEFGMSEKLGSVRYAGQQLQYMGDTVQTDGNLSPHTREVIDDEVRRIVTEQYDRAQDLLSKHRDALDALASTLLEHETLDGSAVREALGEDAS